MRYSFQKIPTLSGQLQNIIGGSVNQWLQIAQDDCEFRFELAGGDPSQMLMLTL